MTAVAYLVRPGDSNEELRHSLRSLANMPHDEVLIVGYRPAWISARVRYIPVEQGNDKFGNVLRGLIELARYGPEEFALFNDDFFCMRPVAGPPAPAHRGLLVEQARTLTGSYGDMLRRTSSVLINVGYDEPLAYTLHAPLLIEQRMLGATLEFRHADPVLSWRSMYGNLAELGGSRESDVKVHSDGPLPAGAWWSTSDASFKYHPVGAAIRKAFPEPSPYEKGEK